MKRLHRSDLYGWSVFNEDRDLDFHSLLWVRDGGNVAVDPLPMSEHDRGHLERLGPLAWIVVTNSDHLRAAPALAEVTGAAIAGPAAERDRFGHPFDRWLEGGETLVDGLEILSLDGSKTPGELALVLEKTTLITGDLVRSHAGGTLTMLPEPKLADRAAAIASVKRLAAIDTIEAVLVGDGWPVFRGGGAALRELAASLS